MIAARADVAQYVIWHRTNTQPLLRTGHPVGAQMLEIDVDALADAVDSLVHVHWTSGSTTALMAVLDRLRTAIQSSRWNRKMTLFQVKTEEVPNDNADAARREFAKLMPITEQETDIEVLQTAISLHGGTLGFSKMIGLCDHIMRLSDSLSVQMQYTAVKAGQYLQIDDVQEAGRLFDRVASLARAAREEGDLELYEDWLFAVTLSNLGLLKRDPALFDEAIAILNGQLALDDWKPGGRERLHRQIADIHRYAERWTDAEVAYGSALAEAESPAATIFLAEVVMRQGRVRDAAAIIDAIDPNRLDRNEYEDYVFALAGIAVESGERTRMEAAARRLDGFQATAAYFERRRLLLLLRVNQAIKLGRTPKILGSVRRLIASGARKISRYAILEPNVGGIGVNVNRALDDIADHIDPPPPKPEKE